MPKSFEGLVPYYEEFVPDHFVKSNGKPVGKRSAQILAKRYNLALVRLGNSVFIDVAETAERLRKAQLADREPRGRGRPAGKATPIPDRPIGHGRLRGGV
jgi:hypothetical protein